MKLKDFIDKLQPLLFLLVVLCVCLLSTVTIPVWGINLFSVIAFSIICACFFMIFISQLLLYKKYEIQNKENLISLVIAGVLILISFFYCIIVINRRKTFMNKEDVIRKIKKMMAIASDPLHPIKRFNWLLIEPIN